MSNDHTFDPSRPTDPTDPLEARLAAYGDVLRGHLAGASAGVPAAHAGNVVPIALAPTSVPFRKRQLPTAAIMGIAASIIGLIALFGPMAFGGSSDGVTVAGGGFADQVAEPATGTSGADGSADTVGVADDADDAEKDQSGDGDPDDSDSKDPDAVDQATKPNEDDADQKDDNEVAAGTDGDDDPDFSRFLGGLGGLADNDDDGDDDDDDGDNEDDGDDLAAGVAAADGEDTADEKDPVPGTGDCPDDAIEKDGRCFLVGPAPEPNAGCPDDAIQLGDSCYVEVDPSCGNLEPAPGGGCLGDVIDPNSGSGGTTYVEATASCDSGQLSGTACLVETSPTGGAACSPGQLHLGNDCYDLVDPQLSCSVGTLTDQGCLKQVDGTNSVSCPAGYQQWETLCYRYVDANVSCAQGQLVDGAWCKITTTGTPGPDSCGDYLEDASGCYILTDPDGEGSCGDLTPIGAQCRYPKPSTPTWTCDGAVTYDPTCYEYQPASVSCSEGYVVDGPKCKIEVDPITETGCPSYAFAEGGSCWKYVDAAVGCGGLDTAPDGLHCKQWAGNAGSGSGSCPAGYELAGDTCKKWLDPTYSCATGTLDIVSGAKKCRIETGGGTVECNATDRRLVNGECRKIVPTSCGELDASPWTDDKCKKPIDTSGGTPTCPAGYELLESKCLKPVARD
ncbi:MAG: hypothetical protein AAF567_02305 [Actinomycetota bacterium]